MATRGDSGPFSKASCTRVRPRALARAYAGSESSSSRVTPSERIKADASRINGYFARADSSTAVGTHTQLKAFAGEARTRPTAVRPKVFLRPDDWRVRGRDPGVFRGPFPGARPCDAGRCPRPRPPGPPRGFVLALPGRRPGPRPRRGQRVRCPHGAARPRLAREGRDPPASLALVRRLCTLPARRPKVPPTGGRLEVQSVPPLRRGSRFGSRGPASQRSDRVDCEHAPPRFRAGSGLATPGGIWESVVLVRCPAGRSHPHVRRRPAVAERPADPSGRPALQRLPREIARGPVPSAEDDPRDRRRHGDWRVSASRRRRGLSRTRPRRGLYC